MEGIAAQGIRARMAVVAVAFAVAGAVAGGAQADALMPDGERIDAVVRAGQTVPAPGTGRAFEPRAEPSSPLPLPEAIAGIAAAVAIGAVAAAAAYVGRRRLRPA